MAQKTREGLVGGQRVMRLNKCSFERSDRDEPHLRRHFKIKKKYPEIMKLEGFDTRTIWVTVAIVLAQICIAKGWQIGLEQSWPWLNIWTLALSAYLVGAILNHWCAMAIHECSHNLAAKSPRANIALALFANIPILVPSAMTFRRYHIDHHTRLGIEGLDTDLPLALERDYIGRSRILKFFWLLFYFFVYVLRGFSFFKPPNRLEVINLFTQLIAITILTALVGPIGLIYLLLSTLFGLSLHPVAAHFIHEHYIFEPGQETYSYYGPLNKVTFNVGYHNEHHDFMNIPGWDLPKVRQLAPEYYATLKSHRSWTYVLWIFIFNRTLGVSSRIIRSVESHKRGRKITFSLVRRKKEFA